MNPFRERDLMLTRRQLFGRAVGGIGTAALASLCAPEAFAAKGLPGFPNFKPTAKRVIYLHQSGAPSQMDLFDPKPKLAERFAEELPDSIRQGQRLTGMTSGQKKFPVAPSKYKFARYGPGGTWMCELLPHTAKVADEICVVKSLFTEAINHDPAITFIQTGSQVAGRPCFGSWVSYGLGSESQDLPAFVVMISRGTGRRVDQPLYDRLWGSGFLPTEYQGVKFRSGGDPVLYLSNPPGIDPAVRRSMLDDIGEPQSGQPQGVRRSRDFDAHPAVRDGVPDADLGPRTDRSFEASQPPRSSSTVPTHARPAPMPRTAFWRGGWPSAACVSSSSTTWVGTTTKASRASCRRSACDTDQPSAALIQDLKQRGMLDDTLVIWGGEFGRTVYCQGNLSPENYGRDHHPRCFSVWLAGGGIKPGISYGETDDYSYNITEKPVHVHDLNATMLHCLGIDHTKLTYRYQGRDFRLTDVHGTVVKDLLA